MCSWWCRMSSIFLREIIFFLEPFSIQLQQDSLIMNNQSSAPSVLTRAIQWINHNAIQLVKNIFASDSPSQAPPRRNTLKYSNLANQKESTCQLGLKHVRDQFKKKDASDKKSNLNDKRKKILQYWNKRAEQQQRPLQLICPICMDFLVGSVSTKCGHTFCWPCIDEATLVSQGCPVCRHHIQGSDFSLCLELNAIIKRYLKRRSRQQQSENEINYQKRVQQFEQWISLRLVNLSKIHPSDLVDIRDTQNIWCSGLVRQVMKVDGKVMLHVHYIGWSSIYDQIISIDSQRLATYKMYSGRKDIPHYQLPLESQGILQGEVVSQASFNQDQSSAQESEEQEQGAEERQEQQWVEVMQQKDEFECDMPSSKALNCFYNPQK